MGVKNEGFDEEVKRMQKIKQVYEDTSVEWCNRMSRFLYDQAVKNTPVDTGNLQRGWQRSPVVKIDKQYRQTVYNNTKYGPYVEYGHRIKRNGEYIGYVDGLFFFRHAIQNYRNARPEMKHDFNADLKARLDKL